MQNDKPLGRKAYGSTPHLPGSRLGPGDHSCHEGQARICCVQKRDRHDRIIVTEKLDGSNVAIAKINGVIVALGRAGYRAYSSPYEQHRMFAQWVDSDLLRWQSALHEGEWISGEWMVQAHGTFHILPHEPFVMFAIQDASGRLPWDEMMARADAHQIITPRIINDGDSFPIEHAVAALSVSGHGAVDPVEGAVWRVERHGEFDFLAKYVRPDKIDGKYLPDISGGPVVWNVQQKAAA